MLTIYKINIYSIPYVLDLLITIKGKIVVFALLFTLGLFLKYYFTRIYTKEPIISFAFLFIFPIATVIFNNWYVGFITPTVWHNVTTILVAPFTILLFFDSIKYLETNDLITLRRMCYWVIINAFIKPSFLFAWVIIYCIFLFYKSWPFTNRKTFYQIIGSSLPALLCLISIFYIYTNTYRVGILNIDRYIDITFFGTWLQYLTWNQLTLYYLPLVLILSLAYPLYILYFVVQDCNTTNPSFIFAWGQLIVSVLLFSFIGEYDIKTEALVDHGNFSWGMYLSAYILYLVSYIESKKYEGNKPYSLIGKGLLIFHIIFGVIYLIRYIITRVYF